MLKNEVICLKNSVPVPPSLLGPIRCLNNRNEKNLAILMVEYDAVPQPTATWYKDGRIITQGSKYEVFKRNSLLFFCFSRNVTDF